MPSPTTSILFLSIIFFINLCDGRSSLELIGLIGSQVLQSSTSNPQIPPFSLPPIESPSSPPSLPQPLNNNMPPSFCPILPPSSPAVLPLPPPQQQRNHPPPSPQLPEPGVPTAAPAPPIHIPTAPGKLEPPPPQQKGAPTYAVWCVAKPTVPEGAMQVAMDYACGSGADCKAIQVNGACYQPDTLLSHASYAFNSYFQNKKGSGGTCDFGGTAMLVTVDPSFNGCHFIFI